MDLGQASEQQHFSRFYVTNREAVIGPIYFGSDARSATQKKYVQDKVSGDLGGVSGNKLG